MNPLQKWAVVTGSSSGIGQAIAIKLASNGTNIIVHGNKNMAGAQQTATQIEKLGCEAIIIHADLKEPTEQDRFAEAAWEIAPIDIWVNNAGADVLTGEAASWSFEKKLQTLWEVDVLATIRLSRILGKYMKQRGKGVLLNVSWDQAEIGMGGESGELFSTTKGAILAFSRSLAKSLAPEVRVNILAPGWIKTSWGETASSYWKTRAQEESLLQRWGTPEDVANVAYYLASEKASFITGQTFAINGGLAGMKLHNDEEEKKTEPA